MLRALARMFRPCLLPLNRLLFQVDLAQLKSRGFFRPLLLAQFRTGLSLHNIHHSGVRASMQSWCARVFVGKKWVLLCPLPSTAYTVRKERFFAMCPSRLPTFHSPPPPPWTAQLPFIRDGSRGSASITSNRGHSSNPLCGPAFVLSSPSHTTTLLPTIHSLTAECFHRRLKGALRARNRLVWFYTFLG